MAVVDPGVLCFQHCDPKAKIFCFSLPPKCPICDDVLATAYLRIPPFRLPWPFTDALRAPCSVLIKPTHGDFLNTYQNSADLHIGISSSTGTVYEFSKNGMVDTDSGNWKQCLSVNIVPELNEKWKDYWDYTLEIVAHQDRWTAERLYDLLHRQGYGLTNKNPIVKLTNNEKYQEDDYNCYVFVLGFLRSLQIPSLVDALRTKTAFCQQFIVPRTTSAGKYISLFRRLKEESAVVHK